MIVSLAGIQFRHDRNALFPPLQSPCFGHSSAIDRHVVQQSLAQGGDMVARVGN